MACVCEDRERQYGKLEDNFATIADLWGNYLMAAYPTRFFRVGNREFFPCFITGKDVAVMMALLKIARIATGKSVDSYVDLAGYAACAGEIAEKLGE